MDDENDPLNLNKTAKRRNKIRLDKKIKIIRENSPVLNSSDDEQSVKRVKTAQNIYKSRRSVLSRPDGAHDIINICMDDDGERKKIIKTQNMCVNEISMNLEDENKVPLNTCTSMSRSRPLRKCLLKKNTGKTLTEKCTRMKNNADFEFKSEKPEIDLILEVEDEQPTLESLAKKISNLKVKSRYVSKTEKKRKYLKCCGKAYITKSGILVPPKSLGPPCWCRKDTYCKKFALTQEQRKRIFKTYWGFGDSNKQLAFIIKFTTKCNRKLPVNLGQGLMNRDFTYRYYLPVTEDLDGENVRVCRKMFTNTLSSNLKTSIVWRKYETICGLIFKNSRANRDYNKITSVCEHFRILQESKLSLLKQRAAGLYTKIETFGIKKMFSHYQDWFDRDKYSDKAGTWPEYKQILARNIPQDHIRTLQQGDRKIKPKTDNKDDGKICVDVENIKKVNTKTKVIFRKDDEFVEESDCESVHSNFSDELPEIETTLETESDSDSDSVQEEVIDSVKSRKSVQRRKLPDQKDEDEVAESTEGVNYTFGQVIGESLSRQFLTNRGKLIILRPPCTCKSKCFDKITEQQREFVFKHFWRLGKRSNQWSFVVQFTSRKKPKSAAQTHYATTTHRYRFNYFLPVTENIEKDANTVKVCQIMFTHTLVISGKVVMDSWTRLTGDLKDKIGPWMNTKEADEQDINEKTEIKNNETNNYNAQDYTLRKAIVNDKSIDEIELDNTQFDFIYKAMPWEEYLNAVSAKVAKEETILDSSTELHQDDKVTKRSKRKRRRNKTGNVAEKSLGSPCNCLRRCSEKIDEEQRRFIFNFYWSLDGVAQQWAFLVRFSERYVPERRSIDQTVPSLRRQYSFKFYLPISKDLDGEKVQICKVMLCHTLAISSTVNRAWRYFSKGKLIDKRGKYKCGVTDDTRNSVKEHLLYLQGIDPDLHGYKFSNAGWLKFKRIYRNYEQWLESSKYSTSCKPSLHRYRVLLYQALNLTTPSN